MNIAFCKEKKDVFRNFVINFFRKIGNKYNYILNYEVLEVGVLLLY